MDMIVWQRSEIFFLPLLCVQEIAFYSLALLIINRLSEILVSATSTLLPCKHHRSGQGKRCTC